MSEEDHRHLPPPSTEEEEQMQELRLKASELLLREEWQDSVQVYTQFITLCRSHIQKHPPPTENSPKLTKIQRSLSLALSNRAEAHFRLRDSDQALRDCDQALEIEPTHFKSLLCKGRILLNLNSYTAALRCFKSALQEDPQSNDTLNGYIERCRKLESLSRTGAFDLSDWVLNGFRSKPPELAEYIGAVKIKRSDELGGRGLFTTKSMEAGTLLLATKAIATERCIISSEEDDSAAQLVMWKSFVDQVSKSAANCSRIRWLISTLSTGDDDEASLQVPETERFIGEENEEALKPEVSSTDLLNILDVNSLVEDSVSAKVLGKNSDYYGVGLWILPSFINHSCIPNSRRLHVGDYVLVHLSRDVKAGEELTFGYFDVLSPLEKRKEMSRTWGFDCRCRRCKLEEGLWREKQELKEIETVTLEEGKGMADFGGMIFRIEEAMRRWNVRGREKGYLRASFWSVYEEGYASEKAVKRWGRRIPGRDVVVESVAEAVGNDERLMKASMQHLSKKSAFLEVERAMKLGKGVYGKVVKKQALRSLMGFAIQVQNK